MRVAINGIVLNYVERGLPQGVPVVFLHGFPFNHTMWDPQMMALPHEVRAVAFDFRGHGSSDVGHGQYFLEYFVDDLFALMDHLGIGSAALCGLSMGGYVALRAAQREPGRVSALVLADTRSEADPNEAKVKRAQQATMVRTHGVEAFAEGFLKAVLAPETLARNRAVTEKVRTMITQNSSAGIAGTLIALATRTDTTDFLASIAVPSLILVGQQDTLTPPEAARALHSRIASSELHVIPGAAHLSNMENPGSFNASLLAFLKRLH